MKVNRVVYSTVALAVGAVLMLGLFNVYKPQLKNLTENAFYPVWVGWDKQAGNFLPYTKIGRYNMHNTHNERHLILSDVSNASKKDTGRDAYIEPKDVDWKHPLKRGRHYYYFPNNMPNQYRHQVAQDDVGNSVPNNARIGYYTNNMADGGVTSDFVGGYTENAVAHQIYLHHDDVDWNSPIKGNNNVYYFPKNMPNNIRHQIINTKKGL